MALFRRNTSDLLDEAHTLGLGALTLFEELAGDLETAAQLAATHATDVEEQIEVLQSDLAAADQAADKYRVAAKNIRGLVSA